MRLVDHDERWPALYDAEGQRILGHTAPLPLVLEHIGGTSIPGIPAKPIIDIAAGRPADAPIQAYVAALIRAGYEHRGERGIPGRQYFRRGSPRAYHVHLVEHGGPLWGDYLAFRDYLRTHPDEARAFSEIKRALATRFASDREGYLDAKSAYVEDIIRLARPRSSSGPRPDQRST